MRADVTQARGWVATCVFVASYFFSRASSLRAVQMTGAAIWIAYGVLINAKPVNAANALVLTAARLDCRARPVRRSQQRAARLTHPRIAVRNEVVDYGQQVGALLSPSDVNECALGPKKILMSRCNTQTSVEAPCSILGV